MSRSRPAIKKRTRDPVATRAQILDVAFWEIYRNGFHHVSVNDIAEKAGLTKGAFFHHFPTKEALGYALVDEVLTRMVLERWITPLNDYENPLEGISANLKKIIDEMPEETLSLGCPLNNLVQEMSSVDPIFRDKLHGAIETWIAGVEKHLKRAQQRGYLKKETNARRLAEFVVMNHEGAFGMIKSVRDRRVFRSLHASLKEYLSSVQTA
ncbi:MAG TPA: TetR/AcrR family transcriptional regulator [Bdellovibrionales bacterium]|nr:TetR/AcrR family transcriptional regulator [Bdellovibrionales bacterium]